MKQPLRRSLKWRVRKWLHYRAGYHGFCRVKVQARRVIDRYDYSERWLVGRGEDGSEYRVNATTFGGEPVYRTDYVVIHT